MSSTLALTLPSSRGDRLARTLAYLLRIRRPEFLVAEIPIVLVPALLTATSIADLRTATFAEGLLAVYLMFNFGDMVNCLYDRDLDAAYKPHLSKAVYGLGVHAVRWQIAVTASLVVVLTTHVAWQLDRWLLVPMSIIGLALGAAYSRPPIRLKGRGIAHLATLWTIIFVGPMLFVSMLLAPLPPAHVVGISAAYATLQMGIILFNTAEDFPEDRAASVTTTIVALGLRRGISLAAVLIGAGGVALVAALVSRAPLGSGWFAAAVCALTVVVTGTLTSAVRVRAQLNGDLAQGLAIVRRTARLVPLALTLVAWTSLAAAYAAFRAGAP